MKFFDEVILFGIPGLALIAIGVIVIRRGTWTSWLIALYTGFYIFPISMIFAILTREPSDFISYTIENILVTAAFMLVIYLSMRMIKRRTTTDANEH